MASIQKRGLSYRARITRQGKSTLCATFYSRLEALQWAKDIEAKLHLGIFEEITPKVARNITFRQAAQHYMDTHSIHKKIVRCETSRLNILIKRWGDLPIEQVNKPAILKLRDDLLSLGRSGETINHYFNTLSKLFQMLVGDWDLNIANPIKGIKRMPASPGRSKRVTAEIEGILLESCNTLSLTLLPSILTFAIETGMRRGEIMMLCWDDIDLANRKAYLHITKNGEPRQVPLTRRALAIIEALERKPSGKVFPMSYECLRSQFERIKEHAKSKWSGHGKNPFEDLRFHDLRHEALSRLSDAGLNVIELSYISGHKTLGMLKRYTHPSHQAIFMKLDDMSSEIS